MVECKSLTVFRSMWHVLCDSVIEHEAFQVDPNAARLRMLRSPLSVPREQANAAAGPAICHLSVESPHQRGYKAIC